VLGGWGLLVLAMEGKDGARVRLLAVVSFGGAAPAANHAEWEQSGAQC